MKTVSTTNNKEKEINPNTGIEVEIASPTRLQPNPIQPNFPSSPLMKQSRVTNLLLQRKSSNLAAFRLPQATHSPSPSEANQLEKINSKSNSQSEESSKKEKSIEEKIIDGEQKTLKEDKPTKVEKKSKKPSACKLKMRRLLEHWAVQTLMTTITIYILFADDVKLLSTAKSADNIFSAICVTIMALFTIEFTISCLVVENYFLGFYFWLDFVSILSMMLDVHWFYDYVIQLISGGSTSTTKNTKTLGAIAKAGRAAKVGSRAIRILRILRIIRLVRISKLYKATEKLIETKLNQEKKN